jgi:hypothetical protein
VFIAFTNGKFAVGWLHEAPVFVVSVTVSDQEFIYGPGSVAGVQTPQGFYVYQPDAQRFTRMTNAEFFVAAIASSRAARQTGFWLPSKEVEPPAGYDKRSAGVVGLGLFARSAASLMTMWTTPAGRPTESGKNGSSDTMRLYRDTMIELQVQEAFSKLRPADQSRVTAAVMGFLERRGADSPLSADEVVRLAETLGEMYADRRGDAITFAHLLSRFFEQAQREQRTGKKQ